MLPARVPAGGWPPLDPTKRVGEQTAGRLV